RATEKGKLTGLTALHPSLLFTTLCHLLLTYFVSLCRTQIPTHNCMWTHTQSHIPTETVKGRLEHDSPTAMNSHSHKHTYTHTHAHTQTHTHKHTHTY